MIAQFNTICKEDTLYDAWNAIKSKGSAGGVDGMSIEEFNKDKINQIKQLKEELQEGEWKPQPYLQITIPKTKDPSEKRVLFLPNSYAYRPGKGALKTIKYIVRHCGNKEYLYALRLDVDNFFDEIDHSILQQRLTAIGVENELIRTI
jgi:retron-type reverse transcriptase